MKQILQSARSGDLEIVEVPDPLPQRGQVRVRNHFSVMSPGTERDSLAFARSSLFTKARSRPDLVRQVVSKWKVDGILATYRTVTTRLDQPQPLGYSSAGVVEAVGPDVTTVAPGDRVACAGAGYANHAEIICVPENLVAPVPAGVPLEQAAFSTLGSIALQCVRVAEPTLGEAAAVVGLGLIGQLAVQLLRANGCRVLGLDLNERRAKQALDQGAEWAETPDTLPSTWKEDVTGGHGVDFAVVAASAANSAPLQLAAELCRHKGRLAVVGAMPLEIERRSMYDKELDLRMSMSYGPGRYDRGYEEMGHDYPIAYVRWTENRNLQAFLALTNSGSLHIDRLDTKLASFEDAISSYEELASGRSESLAVVFRYESESSPQRTLSLPGRPRPTADALGVSFIGAGNYAKALLLPLLDRRSDVHRLTLVTATGASARRTAEKFGFSGCGTNPEAVFKDPNVNLVFIATRHDTHVPLALRALDEGKAVWLEKPVALNRDDLQMVIERIVERDAFFAVGYNRRFSSHSREIKDFFEARSGPLSIHYNVAAGPPPRDSWTMDPEEGGGRVIGEMGHFIDLANYLVGRPCESVYARFLANDVEIDDSMLAILNYSDGSTCTLEYLAHMDPTLPKERFEVSGDGKTARCTNFRVTELSNRRNFRSLGQDKGQATEIREVVQAVQNSEPSPFRLEEIDNVSRVTFAMIESAASRAPIKIDHSS
ncbi:MAG: bi-domain-containing oxidoreductase [Myxococcota bacterium]|nr:bi-domain-containing oxidoreductase [Myxococcota bacterium]